MRRRLNIAFVLISFFLVSGAYASSDLQVNRADSEGIPIAFVNGTPIFQSDFNCAVEAWNFSSPNGTKSELSGILNRLIVIELLYQESLKHRFHGLVGDAEEAFMREVQRAGGEEKLRSTLQCNNISLQQFRRNIFRNLAITRLLDEEVYSKIVITDTQIHEYYEANKDNFKVPESVRIRQIFIKLPQTKNEKTLQEVESRAHFIFQKAVKGDDFVTLARKYSDDPTASSMGGEMGVIYKGNLHHDFESIVFNRGEGSVTEPVRSPGGFRIFQVVSISPPVLKPLDEVRSGIAARIRKSKARAMISEYVLNLRKNADIRILQEDNGN